MMGLSGEALRSKVEEAATLCGLPLELLDRFPHQLSGGQRARVGYRPRHRSAARPAGAGRADRGARRFGAGDHPASCWWQLRESTLASELCLRQPRPERGAAAVRPGGGDVSWPHRRSGAGARGVRRAAASLYPRPGRGGAAAGWRAADALRLAGDPRSPIDPDPNACRFHGRCPVGTDRCGVEMPPLRRFPGGREVACHYAEVATHSTRH